MDVRSQEPIEAQAGWLLRHIGVWRRQDLVVVDVTGEDAGSWLQGQMTNDVGKLTAGRALYAFVLTVKGRILADVWVVQEVQQQGVWSLLLPKTAIDDACNSMQQQIIMEDVTLTRRDDVQVWAALGPKAALWAQRVRESGGSPTLHHADLLGHTGYVWQVRPEASVQRTDCEDGRESQWLTFARELGGGPLGPEAVRVGYLKLGIPMFGLDFSVEHHPQETGLAPWAVSFDKGCYFGQEVVCMIEARGKPPRRMVRLVAERRDVPLDAVQKAPQPLYQDEGGAAAQVGVLTQLAVDPENHDKWMAMGYVKRAVAEQGSVLKADGGLWKIENLVG